MIAAMTRGRFVVLGAVSCGAGVGVMSGRC
jgi:hypothetical protein